LRLFDPSIVGLTSDDVATRALATQFGVGYKLEKATPDQKDYSVTHTASSFLVDREGRLARLYSYDLKFDAIAADIQQMLLTDKSG
ncbi:MAG TPA: SCO family protein, partial [Aggregatilineaceae bacterium]|nr:SCO family protein [Aggregatilineaceae bacterium]